MTLEVRCPEKVAELKGNAPVVAIVSPPVGSGSAGAGYKIPPGPMGAADTEEHSVSKIAKEKANTNFMAATAVFEALETDTALCRVDSQAGPSKIGLNTSLSTIIISTYLSSELPIALGNSCQSMKVLAQHAPPKLFLYCIWWGDIEHNKNSENSKTFRPSVVVATRPKALAAFATNVYI
jgi:hypothetical protein